MSVSRAGPRGDLRHRAYHYALREVAALPWFFCDAFWPELSQKGTSERTGFWKKVLQLIEFYGARGRTRTGTGLPPKDFKSFASTIPPLGRETERLVVRARNRNRPDEPLVSRARSVRSGPASSCQTGRKSAICSANGFTGPTTRVQVSCSPAGIFGQDRPWLSSAGRQTRVLWRAGTMGRRSSCCRGLWQRPYVP